MKKRANSFRPFLYIFVVQDAEQDLIVARAENSLQEIDVKRNQTAPAALNLFS